MFQNPYLFEQFWHKRKMSLSQMRIIFSILVIVALSSVCPLGLKLEATGMMAGPMVGHTTLTSAKIWFETDEPANIRIDYWQEPRLMYDPLVPEPIERGRATGRTASDFPHTGIVELTGLNPGWLIHYDVFINNRKARPLSTQIFSLFPPEVIDSEEPDDVVEFSVAFASCDFPARIPIQPIWAQVVRRRPVAFLFLGDNNYLPNKPENLDIDGEDLRFVISDTHRTLKNVAGVRELMASTASYGIWDDHDYGPGDSDRTFQGKEISLDVFRRYWANPASGIPDPPGVFHSFRIADAEFFLLDDRYNRDPNKAEDRSTMLGAVQLEWLKKSLKMSTATFKIIGNGGTLAVDEGKETWHRFGPERDDFLKWMFDQKIEGVLFIAGDWHVGVLNRLHRPQDAYPLYELLSSNVAVKIIPRGTVEIAEGPSNNQWVSPFVLDYNFGLLRFGGKRDARTVTLQIIDEQGVIRVELQVNESDLSYR